MTTKIDDQRALLGNRNKKPGKQQPSLGMLPSRKGLDPDNRARLARNDRLIPGVDATVVDCAPQIRLEAVVAPELSRHRLVECRPHRTPRRLSPIQRNIGETLQVVRFGGVLRKACYTDRASEGKLLPVIIDGFAHGLGDGRRNVAPAFPVKWRTAEDSKLVSAQPADGLLFSALKRSRSISKRCTDRFS